ncbi:hypothetical protein FA15DRAFT_672177 [Coprinopsis marcescibilis]|uniref:F-box domain-containing protein n=1 Tax=Coprinopsis marcescibilis TaxID=230819 RepID=A0A5C3KPK0_COPMA|nr:hypothetical protein FA15DRAFT_672177 [Coprinopsis marcescibilis]
MDSFLPVELLRKVFLHSTESPGTHINILLVCRTTHAWLVPLIYHSITLTDLATIRRFVASHDVMHHRSRNFQFIRSLWIGSTPHDSCGWNVNGSSTDNPTGTISHLVWLCKNLERLTMLYHDFRPERWRAFEWTLPKSLKYLTLGPGLGPICPAKIFVSLDCYTGIFETFDRSFLQEILSSTSMKTIRYIVNSDRKTADNLKKLIVSTTKYLEGINIVIADSERWNEDKAVQMERMEAIARGTNVSVSRLQKGNWLEMLFAEHIGANNRFIYRYA